MKDTCRKSDRRRLAGNTRTSRVFSGRRQLPADGTRTRREFRNVHPHQAHHPYTTENSGTEPWTIRSRSNFNVGHDKSLGVRKFSFGRLHRFTYSLLLRFFFIIMQVVFSRYYLATQEHKSSQRHLYVVRDPSTDDPRRLEPQCITCDLGDVLWSSRYYYSNCTHFSAMVTIIMIIMRQVTKAQ